MSGSRDHDWGFVKWFVAGFLVVFGVITGFTIGLPFLLIGVIWFAWLLWRGPGWPADLGLPAGAGAVCLLIAVISAVSGDLSPIAWAAVGLALAAPSSIVFWWLRCRPAERSGELSA